MEEEKKEDAEIGESDEDENSIMESQGNEIDNKKDEDDTKIGDKCKNVSLNHDHGYVKGDKNDEKETTKKRGKRGDLSESVNTKASDDSDEADTAENSDVESEQGRTETNGDEEMECTAGDDDLDDTADTNEKEDDTVEEEEGIMIDEKDVITREYGRGKRLLNKTKDKEMNTDDDDGSEDDEEEEEEEEDDEDDPIPDSIKKTGLTTDEEELLLLPFKSGWKREVVFRKTGPNVGSPRTPNPADVYYRPPAGRKLRSMVDVAKHLVMTNSDMTTDNFSFTKKPLFKPPYEVVRHAGTVGRRFGMAPIRGRSPAKKKMGRPPKIKRTITSKPEIVIERDEDGPDSTTPFKQFSAGISKRGRPPKIKKVFIFPKRRKRSLSDSPKNNVEIIKQDGDDSMLHLMAVSESDMSMDDTPPPHKKYKPTARKSTTQKTFKPSVDVKQNSTTDLVPLCNLNCPGQEKIPPDLQCVVCLCLFHPYCVNADPILRTFVCLRCVDQKVNAALKSTKQGQNMTQPTVIRTVPTYAVKVKQEPMDFDTYGGGKDDPARTNTNISQATLGNLKSVLGKRVVTTINSTVSDSSVLVKSLNSPLGNTSKSFSVSLINNSSGQTTASGLRVASQATQPVIVRPTLTTVYPAVSVIPNIPNFDVLNSQTSSNVRITTPVTAVDNPPLSIANLSSFAQFNINKQTVFMPKLKVAPFSQSKVDSETPPLTFANGVDLQQAAKNGQLLTLPTAVSKRLNLQQPMALKINNKQITVPPSCFLQTADGLKVVLPPKTFPVQSGETAKLSVTVTSEKQGLSSDSNESLQVMSVKSSNTSTEYSPEKLDVSGGDVAKRTRKSRCWRDGINPGNCFFKKLYGGFDSMLCVFQYLNIQDLARASAVCRTWHQVARHPCLWQEVRFRNLKVIDWQKAVNFLLARAAKCLNLKGLQHIEDRSRMWCQLVSVLPKLTTVNTIHFGLVPASVLHSICERMSHLEVLTAQWISNYSDDEIWTQTSTIDVGKFAILKDLKELQLRGTAGLALPKFSLEGGISDIASLKNLKKLSLTTLKGVLESDLMFLSDMNQLQVLELGDCSGWSSEMYSSLGKLQQLKCLRLESGGDCGYGLGEMLTKLKKLETLELIIFVIAESLCGPMQEMENLHTLVVWPNTTTQSPAKVNSSTLKVISNLTKLKKLEWGILSNKNSSIILDNNDSAVRSENNPNSDQTNLEWIPFLPSNADPNEVTEPVFEYVNVFQFTEKLSKILPDTKIKVYSSSMVDTKICVREIRS